MIREHSINNNESSMDRCIRFIVVQAILLFYQVSIYGHSTFSNYHVNSSAKDASDVIPCPANCSCSPSTISGPQLVIDCSSDTNTNSTLLAEEIDRLLISRRLVLTDLTVTRSSLTFVPSSICLLENLRRLNLDNNRLSSLPQPCFSNLTKLDELSATNNKLTDLQDGVFNDLSNLQVLNLGDNQIASIGLHVFTADANLKSLRQLWLARNLLTELEPWPFIHGQLVPGSNISLYSNRITRFTNRIGWKFKCGTKPELNLYLNLYDNNIAYISDITNGWNVTETIDIICLYSSKPYSPLHLLINSPHTCDCRDFQFYFVAQRWHHITMFDHIYCELPKNLHGKLMKLVPLDQFVCQVPPPVCPDSCQCVKIPANRTYVVSCPNATRLPPSLPDTRHPGPFKCQYSMNFANSNVDVIDFRYYFNDSNAIDVSRSRVQTITDDAWRAFAAFSYIDLSNNRLSVLPTILMSENLTYKSLVLEGNPWRCECRDQWIRNWMSSQGEGLVRSRSILCRSPQWNEGKNILSLTDEDFCSNPKRERTLEILQAVIPAVCGTVLLIVCLVIVVYRYRIAMFTRFNFHPFDVDECEGEDMIYDVFLSCAYEDRDIGLRFVERLEQIDADNDRRETFGVHDRGYRVCYHERDFTPGSMITENIQKAIERSKRVVCLLTNDFMRSDYCMLEFNIAWNHSLKLNKRRLVVIVWPEVDVSALGQRQLLRIEDTHQNSGNEVPEEDHQRDYEDTDVGTRPLLAPQKTVELFLSTHTYIEYKKEDWWQQLIYALPISRVLPA